MVRGDPRVVSCAVHSGDDGDRVIVLYFAGDDPDERGQVKWCSACGAFNCDGTWREPSGLMLPGWFCRSCKRFMGEAKQRHEVCLYCEQGRQR